MILNGTQTRLRTNFNNSVGVNAVHTQTIIDPAVFASVKIVKLTEELSKLNNDNLLREIVTRASGLYWQAIYTKESIKVLTENSELAKEQYDLIKKFFDKGVASELQLQQVEVYYKRTLPDLFNTKNQYESLVNELKNIANIPLEEPFKLMDGLENIELGILLKYF